MDNTMTTILINGIGSLLGARVAQILSADDSLRLVGLDRRMPIAPVGRAEVLTAAPDGQQLVELLRAAQVTCVIHLAFLGEEEPAPDREAAVQQNVLGSMELLGACVHAGVQRVVLRSSTQVYGAVPTNPVFIPEQQPTVRPRHSTLLRDYFEVEAFAADFAHIHPELQIVVLRCAGLLGGGGWSPLTYYLTQANPPTLLGFDPRIQVLHLDDAAVALALAATGQATGCFNLAADPPVKLVQTVRLAGHQPLLCLEPFTDAAAALGLTHDLTRGWPFERAFLRYACVADTRRAQAELGWSPGHDAAAVLRELGEGRNVYAAREQTEVALQTFLSRRSQS
jgi:UDP-glucose 4-epimerase